MLKNVWADRDSLYCISLCCPWISKTPFLNFPLWSCPALWHAHWRPRRSQSPEGQEDPDSDRCSCCSDTLAVPTISTLYAASTEEAMLRLFFGSFAWTPLLHHTTAKCTVVAFFFFFFLAVKVRWYTTPIPRSFYWIIMKERRSFVSVNFLVCPPVADASQ